MVYDFNKNARIKSGVNPQAVGEEIEQLEVVTPENIVLFAENDKTELHKCFTWEEHRAAHNWRLQEARLLVNALIVFEDGPNEEPVEVPVFESVIKGDRRQYVVVSQEITDDDIYEQIRGDVLSSISSLKNKLNQYAKYRKESSEKAQYHLELAREAVTV